MRFATFCALPLGGGSCQLICVSVVFICYRRNDSPHFVGRLYDYLQSTKKLANIYIDYTILVGADFPAEIHSRIERCDTVIVIIGARWVAPASELQDWVTMEIENAFDQGKDIVPVLVDDAEMPGVDELSPRTAGLAHRNAAEFRDPARFSFDANRLLQRLLMPQSAQFNLLSQYPKWDALNSATRGAVLRKEGVHFLMNARASRSLAPGAIVVFEKWCRNEAEWAVIHGRYRGPSDIVLLEPESLRYLGSKWSESYRELSRRVYSGSRVQGEWESVRERAG